MLVGFVRKPLQCLFNATRHRNVASAFVVIPLHVKANIAYACPVDTVLVFGSQAIKQRINIGFARIFGQKLSTTRQKLIGWVLCFHNPGVAGKGKKPNGANTLRNCSLVMRPVCGKPYIFCQILTYTKLL